MTRSPSAAEVAFQEAVAGRIASGLSPTSVSSAQALPGASLERSARRLLLSSRAKRARALLCAAVGRHVGADPAVVVDCAAVVEMVHGASLLHDDVVDEADVRRGEATARAEGGNAFAVLAGDLVLSRALTLLLPHGPALWSATVAVVDEMTRAALVEIEDRGQLDLPVDRWMAMAAGKTGALFGLCARLPALSAGVEAAHAERLERAFRSFGVAFQIVDDILDLRGGDPGKARGQDLREHNPSLPVLAAVTQVPALATALHRVHRDIDDAALVPLCERVLEAGLPWAVDAARARVQDALAALGDDASALGEVVAWATALVEEATGPRTDNARRPGGGKARTDEGIPARGP
ncbi:MAG: polyprenyl synthetase family protein [Deltaproteobacteria bacterium]|nr:polyprenyl synthetase family protein [Deltaproteobacteria bacterium]